VLLIGAAGSGKSTFARRWFAASDVISSDALRQAVRPTGKKRRTDVFEAILGAVEPRLTAGELTVVDATNTDWMRRSTMLAMARERGRPAVAIVLNPTIEETLRRNRERTDRRVPDSTVREQQSAIVRDLDRLDLEGFAQVVVLDSMAASTIDVQIKRGPVTRTSSS
jgi:protein phosphatase